MIRVDGGVVAIGKRNIINRLPKGHSDLEVFFRLVKPLIITGDLSLFASVLKVRGVRVNTHGKNWGKLVGM